jgi:hypothetical protein
LGISSVVTRLTPVRLPPGRAKTGDQAGLDRVSAGVEDDRDRRGRPFCRERRRVAALGHDHVDLAIDEIGRQCEEPIIMALRPAVFDRDVLSLDVTGVT